MSDNRHSVGLQRNTQRQLLTTLFDVFMSRERDALKKLVVCSRRQQKTIGPTSLHPNFIHRAWAVHSHPSTLFVICSRRHPKTIGPTSLHPRFIRRAINAFSSIDNDGDLFQETPEDHTADIASSWIHPQGGTVSPIGVVHFGDFVYS